MKLIGFNELRNKLAGRGRSSIYRDISLGRLPKPRKLGSRLYWVEEEIDAMISNLTE
ncbi:helix-turn-helix transcriptional regulator [Ruegeria marina]|uniref:Transcriptional regulator, AlpA family n=1 Tax=Ruegeria marina TaxID=639004 RepID=A0A1G6S3Z6_9RHOB|nr:AlpA family phage regulatory protein [Ruegeria marina]SDD11579.1 transcriptional regulator, AlpA family [Ruegeria marina]